MVLVRRLHKRNANIVVEANAEVLFAPTSDVGRWEARLRERIAAAVVDEAPTNKRPRWAHYGLPLKATIRRSVKYQPGRKRIYGAVGSTAPYAYYVDQGTGIYNGSGPYLARILPPWHRGSPSLYESTWVPPGATHPVGSVVIRGQKGQGFFDRGLARGFQSMRLRSFQIPGEGLISGVMNSVPSGLDNFAGNTAANGAFVAQLKEWRAWRDEAWRGNTDLRTGVGRSPGQRERNRVSQQRRAQRRARNKANYKERERLRSQRNRDKAKAANSAKSRNKPEHQKKARMNSTQKAEIRALKYMQAWAKAHPNATIISAPQPWGFEYVDRGGTKHGFLWPTSIADLYVEAGLYVNNKYDPNLRK